MAKKKMCELIEDINKRVECEAEIKTGKTSIDKIVGLTGLTRKEVLENISEEENSEDAGSEPVQDQPDAADQSEESSTEEKTVSVTDKVTAETESETSISESEEVQEIT